MDNRSSQNVRIIGVDLYLGRLPTDWMEQRRVRNIRPIYALNFLLFSWSPPKLEQDQE